MTLLKMLEQIRFKTKNTLLVLSQSDPGRTDLAWICEIKHKLQLG